MNYLIASHGRYAEGIAEVAKSILGKNNIFVVCAYLDERTIGELFDGVFHGREDERWIILTDILGGSVNQEIIKKYMNKNIHVISGINAEVMIKVLDIDETKDIKEQIRSIVADGKNKMVYVNNIINEWRHSGIK